MEKPVNGIEGVKGLQLEKVNDFDSESLLNKRLEEVEQTLKEEKRFAEVFDRACTESSTMKDAMGRHVAKALEENKAKESLSNIIKSDPMLQDAIEERVKLSDRSWQHKVLRAFGAKIKSVCIFVGGIAVTLLVDWLRKALKL